MEMCRSRGEMPNGRDHLDHLLLVSTVLGLVTSVEM
jgi:hypothetical protein